MDIAEDNWIVKSHGFEQNQPEIVEQRDVRKSQASDGSTVVGAKFRGKVFQAYAGYGAKIAPVQPPCPKIARQASPNDNISLLVE